MADYKRQTYVNTTIAERFSGRGYRGGGRRKHSVSQHNNHIGSSLLLYNNFSSGAMNSDKQRGSLFKAAGFCGLCFRIKNSVCPSSKSVEEPA